MQPKEVLKAIRKCKIKAPGADGISNAELKELPTAAIVTLACLFTACLRTGHFPQIWKHAVVKYIPKAGKDHSKIKGHRPISLLSCLGKLLETMFKKRLLDFAETSGYLGHGQAAYRKHRGTADHLLRLSEEASVTLQSKGCLAAAFLDVEGAFDRVWHQGLVYKLQAMRCPQHLIKLTTSYLEGRSIEVNVNGYKSCKFTPEAGVPQGSVISPILYILYVCQIPRLQGTACQFADDIATWCSKKTIAKACSELQISLNKLQSWCTQWRVKLNPTKTQVVLFTRQRATPPALYMNGVRLEYHREATFLGIKFTSTLNWSACIKEQTSRMWPRIARLRVLARAGLSTEALLRVYTTCILPICLYAPSCRAAITANQLAPLQILQNAALRVCLRAPPRAPTQMLHDTAQVKPVAQLLREHAKKHVEKAKDCDWLTDLFGRRYLQNRTPITPIQAVDAN